MTRVWWRVGVLCGKGWACRNKYWYSDHHLVFPPPIRQPCSFSNIYRTDVPPPVQLQYLLQQPYFFLSMTHLSSNLNGSYNRHFRCPNHTTYHIWYRQPPLHRHFGYYRHLVRRPPKIWPSHVTLKGMAIFLHHPHVHSKWLWSRITFVILLKKD